MYKTLQFIYCSGSSKPYLIPIKRGGILDYRALAVHDISLRRRARLRTIFLQITLLEQLHLGKRPTMRSRRWRETWHFEGGISSLMRAGRISGELFK